MNGNTSSVSICVANAQKFVHIANRDVIHHLKGKLQIEHNLQCAFVSYPLNVCYVLISFLSLSVSISLCLNFLFAERKGLIFLL